MEKELLREIANEDPTGEFSGEHDVRAPRSSGPIYRYKVWNNNIKNPTAPTPGIVMTTLTKTEAGYDKSIEIVPSVRAVILYHSTARVLDTGTGKSYRVVCQSHDGVHPSMSVVKPICRNVTAADIANTFSQWKGYDKAKVDVQTEEVTQGTGCLQLCGIKARDGIIPLCPSAKWTENPHTGKKTKPECQPRVFVHAYDIERKREFYMDLKGRSIDTGKVVSPFFQFIKFLREWGKTDQNSNVKGLPSYAFNVKLSPSEVGGFYLLNVSDYQGIQKAENRAEMKSKAEQARDSYLKSSMRPPKTEKTQHQMTNGARKPDESLVKTAPDKRPPVIHNEPTLDDVFDEDNIPF